ncbi:MAG: HEAT repeat domain-containing protein, partial [Candidatus Diapherotrites archaeon]|nr:HEAT repeat domain-containing protein [Candidatus Diapherotrites archaeon]
MKPFSKLKPSTRVRKINVLRAQVKPLKSKGLYNPFWRRLSILKDSPQVRKLFECMSESERASAEKLLSIDEPVRESAVLNHWRFSMLPKNLVFLVEQIALRESNPDIRSLAIRILNFRVSNPKKYIPMLERIAESDRSSLKVRATAITALGDIRSKRSVPLLEKIASGSEFEEGRIDASQMMSAAINSLGKIGSKDSIGVLSDLWLNDFNIRIRLAAASAVANLGYAKYSNLIKSIALETDLTVRNYRGGKLLDILDSKFGSKWHEHRLYRDARANFFNDGQKIVRRVFNKTGSRTVLLGSSLTGKAIVRYVSPESFAAWKKALDAGIPTEPILKSKNGRLRVSKGPIEKSRDKLKQGSVRVFSQVLGPSVHAFLSFPENEEKFGPIVRMQVKKIEADLDRLSIEHRHMHDANFCI